MPPLEGCNASVQLMDGIGNISASGTATWSGYWTDIGAGSGAEWISTSVTRTVGATVSSGANGSIANTAVLAGTNYAVVVDGPLDPTTGLPVFSYSFPCCVAARLCANSEQPFGSGSAIGGGAYGTYTQGGWGSKPSGSNPGALLATNFSTLYPGGLTIGLAEPAGRSMKFTSAAAIQSYLPAGGPPGTLNADLVNPLRSSAGVFGGQVLALRLNVDFSAAGITAGSGGPFGNLKLANTGTSLDGKKVSQILAAAEQALGGGALPSGYTIATLNDLVSRLNESFDNFTAGSWALAHLVP